MADREFVNDGTSRWSAEHARRVIAANGSAALVEPTLERLRAAAQPVPREWLGDRLTVLWTLFMASRAHADPGSLAVWLAEHLRLLGDLPHDVVAIAIDRAVQTARHGFIPSIGDIRTIAEPMTAERQHLIERLERIVASEPSR